MISNILKEQASEHLATMRLHQDHLAALDVHAQQARTQSFFPNICSYSVISFFLFLAPLE